MTRLSPNTTAARFGMAGIFASRWTRSPGRNVTWHSDSTPSTIIGMGAAGRPGRGARPEPASPQGQLQDAHRRERVAMECAWPEAPERLEMLARAIALVPGEPVRRPDPVEALHDAVADHLGEDRSGGD